MLLLFQQKQRESERQHDREAHGACVEIAHFENPLDGRACESQAACPRFAALSD
jgi:hypothetical protein